MLHDIWQRVYSLKVIASLIVFHSCVFSRSFKCWLNPWKFMSSRQLTCTTRLTLIAPLAAWENSRHLVTLPLVSLPNDVWEMSTEFPYWWRVTSQIWVVMCHQYGIFALASQMAFCRETTGGVAKCQLFSKTTLLETRRELSQVYLHKDCWNFY